MSEPSDETVPPPTLPYDSIHIANVASAVFEVKHPARIGPYHIEAVIGEGGMGTVYKAEQREPIQRTVAVKLIKIGMDTQDVIARFESERQAVALMSHANVARVLDAGATELGRPYFVMEYVAGESITAFADHHRLTVRQRLELFLQACDAVQHAHQKGIIHRDLKPSNILVTRPDPGAAGVVKVIDFGIAKATNRRLTEKTLFTETGQLLGTPEYMSPEQADMNALDIDTRTDVYALGVVLYQLLSGVMPFDVASLRSGGYSEIQRIIREVDAPRPSTSLSRLGAGAAEVARCRKTTLRVLEKQLKGELGWIPLKALRKERSERYASAAELADDVSNYLKNLPLRAGPASAAYRARKFLRRNKGPVVAAALVALALVGGVAGTAWQAVRATRAGHNLSAALVEVRQQKQQVESSNQNLQQANQQVREQKQRLENSNASLKAVNEFLTDDLLQSADPAVARGDALTVREALDAASKTVELKFKNQPLVDASIRSTLASTYDALGRADLGLDHARKALEIRRRELGNDDPLTLAALNSMVNLLESRSLLDEADPLCHEAVERTRKHERDQPQLLITALSNMAQLLRARGKPADAEPLCQEAAKVARRAFGNDSLSTLTAVNNIAILLLNAERADQAEPLFRELLTAYRRLLGNDHPDTLTVVANLARTVQSLGKLDEAETLHREALGGMLHVLGETHPTTLLEIRNLGSLYQDRGKLQEAEGLYRQSLESSRKLLGDDHPDTLAAMNHLASALAREGKLVDAVKMDRDLLARCRKQLGDDHPDTISTLNNLGMTLMALEKFDQAEPIFAEAYRRAPASQLDPAMTAYCMSRWGPCLVQLRRYQEAEKPLREAYRRLSEAGVQRSQPMRNVVAALVEMYEQTHRPDEAAAWRAKFVPGQHP